MWQRLPNSWFIGSRKKVAERAMGKILATKDMSPMTYFLWVGFTS